jgi:hypothetical protein
LRDEVHADAQQPEPPPPPTVLDEHKAHL